MTVLLLPCTFAIILPVYFLHQCIHQHLISLHLLPITLYCHCNSAFCLDCISYSLSLSLPFIFTSFSFYLSIHHYVSLSLSCTRRIVRLDHLPNAMWCDAIALCCVWIFSLFYSLFVLFFIFYLNLCVGRFDYAYVYLFWWYARGDWIEQNVLALKYIMSHMSGDLWLFD